MDGSTFFEKVSIRSSQTGQEWDITGGIEYINFFEDILKPAVTCNLQFIDSPNEQGKTAYKDLPITVGSNLYMKIRTPLNGEFEIQYDDLYLYKIGRVERDSTTQKVTLSFTSKEVLKNFSVLVKPRFKGLISQTVESLLRDYLETTKTLDIETTQGQNAVQGLSRRVIMNDNDTKEPPIIPDLARKAIPSNGGEENAGYLFYETSRGYHFKSIDTLLEGESIGTFVHSNVPKASAYRDNSKIIMRAEFEQSSNDAIQQSSSGGSGGKKTVLNFATSTVKTETPNLSTVANGPDQEFVPPELRQTIKPICVVGEFANHQSDAKYKGETASANYNKGWELTAKNRYSSVFGSQVLDITIPGNPKLIVGNTMEIELPDLDNLGCAKGVDEKTSGNYLAKELCHSFTKMSCITSVKVLRNGFGRS
jgi:hypothetical protein